jgi:hypothetical protein
MNTYDRGRDFFCCYYNLVFGKAKLALGLYLSLNEEIAMDMHLAGVRGLCDGWPGL